MFGFNVVVTRIGRIISRLPVTGQKLQDLPAEIRLLVGQEIPPCQKLFRIGHRRDQVVLGAEPLLDILLHEGLQNRPLQGADQVFK